MTTFSPAHMTFRSLPQKPAQPSFGQLSQEQTTIFANDVVSRMADPLMVLNLLEAQPPQPPVSQSSPQKRALGFSFGDEGEKCQPATQAVRNPIYTAALEKLNFLIGIMDPPTALKTLIHVQKMNRFQLSDHQFAQLLGKVNLLPQGPVCYLNQKPSETPSNTG